MSSFNTLHICEMTEVISWTEVIEPHVNCDVPDDIVKVEEIDGMSGWSFVCGPGISTHRLNQKSKGAKNGYA